DVLEHRNGATKPFVITPRAEERVHTESAEARDHEDRERAGSPDASTNAQLHAAVLR
ncbi:MAG: hypothetical protein QOI08_2486, partial [Actinomycetota bacterium]|nr:hypothetical protein [Actinomycetota bacterium]